MIRKTAAALLSLACAAAHAETGWIEVKGFYMYNWQSDDPDFVMSGEFKGTDADGDGVLRTAEVEYFNFYDMQYFAAGPGGCYSPGPVCTLDFEYRIGSGTASFAIAATYIDPEFGYRWHREFLTGVGYAYDYFGDVPLSFLWADYTTMTVTSVPEPSTAGMLLLGLSGLGAAVRRLPGRLPGRCLQSYREPGPSLLMSSRA